MQNNYFTLFNLPEQLDIDLAQLDQHYHLLAARFHPDKVAAASIFEQKQALILSSNINQAHRILKNPTDRAAYLLQQRGIDADSPENTRFASEFLQQQMQWREQLMDAKMDGDAHALSALQHEIQTAHEHIFSQLNQLFTQQEYKKAADCVRQMRFLDKLLHEIQAAL